MKIYTKTGDRGETGMFGGRVSKADKITQALGAIDELNSWIGLVRNNSPLTPLFIKERGTKEVSLDGVLKNIQHNLMVIGTIIAGSKKYRFKGIETTKLERLIDKLEKDLPKLHNFIFPKSFLQIARAVARRAEREVIVVLEQESVRAGEYRDVASDKKNVLKYMNRLSDALFVMGRWVNWKNGESEEIWKS
jgi:cob(I)alamin adenosyltransferase